MHTSLYWTIQHVTQASHDLMFAARCWWLACQIEFCEWRWQLDETMPRPAPQNVPFPS